MPKEPDLLDQEFNERDPRWQIRLLSDRVTTLTKEKEEIEKDKDDLWKKHYDLERKVDRALNRGAGILFVVPFFGIVVGWLMAYGSKFLRTGE